MTSRPLRPDDRSADSEEFTFDGEDDPFTAGEALYDLHQGGPTELPHLRDALHVPVGGVLDPAEALPYLEVSFDDPERVHRFIVENPGEAARQVLRGFAASVAEHHTVEDFARMYDLGLGFLQMERYEEAAVLLIPLAAGSSEDRVGAAEALAHAFFQLGRLNEAHAYLLSVLPPAPRDPVYAGIFFWLGQVAEERGDPRNALVYYAHALELQPDLVEARQRLRVLVG